MIMVDGTPQLTTVPEPIQCIFPVWDPGSPSSIALECGDLDGNHKDIVMRAHSVKPHWKKVEQ